MRDELPGIPDHGWPADEVLDRIDARRAGDLDWRGGRAFSLVYNPGDEGLERLLHAVADRYLHENALNPFRYPSLLAMEQEVVAMGCRLLGTAPDAGALTSGGTESIFLAVQVARDAARTGRGIAEPQLLTASTAHPAFAKAAKYLDVEHVRVPVGPDGRADVDAMAAAIGDRTGLVVGSAPCYPFGVVDPIGDLAAAAAERGVLFHTDACLGGWLLPWLERLGEPVPAWDFRVPGVTSVSADVHKYGYGFKGASIVAYRDRTLLTRQHFWYDDWPGGLYASGTTAGTRPAAPIAGAWAAVTHLGVDGYLRMATAVRDTTRRFVHGIDAVAGLAVDPRPDAAAMQITATAPTLDGPQAGTGAVPARGSALDLGALGDAMDRRGWALDRQQGGLHLMVSPYHAQVVERFLVDLGAAAAEGGTSEGVGATYGGIA
ncbi:MAG: aspartate aminotransferase family protein [Actinobacteria bacterium]|nr:aspartate aminotransferase family protein [Actinomycetota bacterium]